MSETDIILRSVVDSCISFFNYFNEKHIIKEIEKRIFQVPNPKKYDSLRKILPKFVVHDVSKEIVDDVIKSEKMVECPFFRELFYPLSSIEKVIEEMKEVGLGEKIDTFSTDNKLLLASIYEKRNYRFVFDVGREIKYIKNMLLFCIKNKTGEKPTVIANDLILNRISYTKIKVGETYYWFPESPIPIKMSSYCIFYIKGGDPVLISYQEEIWDDKKYYENFRFCEKYIFTNGIVYPL